VLVDLQELRDLCVTLALAQQQRKRGSLVGG
jgi:hypothetical protein